MQHVISNIKRFILFASVAAEVANDVGTLLKLTADVRGSIAKIRSYSEKIDEGLDEIRSALKDYQHKLRSAIGGTRNDALCSADDVKS
jgi:hypothetical protein